MLADARLPNGLNRVLSNESIGGEQWNRFRLRLCDQQPIERVSVMIRESSHAKDVAQPHRQHAHRHATDVATEELLGGPADIELSFAHFDDDFPSAGDAEDKLRLIAFEDLARRG